MSDSVFTVPDDLIDGISLRRINTLPFGMLEVNPKGTILKYFPCHYQSKKRDPNRICGRNLFEDPLMGVLLVGLRKALPILAKRAAGIERLQFIFPFRTETVGVSFVAHGTSEGAGVRISVSRRVVRNPPSRKRL